MPRENGWLKADALRTAGVAEQWAKEIDGVHHEVSLRHDMTHGGYVTTHVALHLSTLVREVHTWQCGDALPLARQFFRQEVKSLGGRA